MMIYENHIHSCTAYVNAYNHHVHVTTAVEIIRKKGKKPCQDHFKTTHVLKRKDLLVGVRTDNHKKMTQKLRQY